MSYTVNSTTSSSTSSTTSSSSTIRITGLATGLDVDAVVKTMMQPYNTKVDKAKQAMQIDSWKQEIYRGITTTMNTMKNKYFDVLSQSNYILSPSSLAKKAVTVTAVTDSTGAAATAATTPSVTVNAGGDATDGLYTIDVTKAPTNASISSTSGTITSLINKNITKSSKLSELATALGITLPSNLKFTYDTDSTDSTAASDVSIPLTQDMTVSDLIDKVSTESDGNVKLDYYQLGGFKLSATNYGKNSNIGISTDNSTTFTALGFNLNPENETTTPTSFTGENGTATITYPNGTSGTKEITSNKLVMDGLSIIVNGKGKSTVSISKDTDGAFDKIKSFITDYNNLIDALNTQITGKRDYDYPPLTDSQKESMTTDQITSWETKAKVGLLANDSQLTSLTSTLRSEIFGTALSSGKGSLSDFGLSTSDDYSKGGKIILDETKLKKALDENSDKVINAFAGTSSSQPTYSATMSYTDRQTRYSQEGIFNRISDVFNDYIRTTRDSSGNKGIFVQKAGIVGDTTETTSILSESIADQQDKIDELKDKMSDIETSYYNKFSKLEALMNTLNTQQSYITSMLSS